MRRWEIVKHERKKSVIGPFGRQKMPDTKVASRKMQQRSVMVHGTEEIASRSIVIPCALLKFNQSPPACFGVVDVLGYPGDTDGVCDLLDLVVHAGCQLSRLGVLVDVDLLGPAGKDEDWNFTGLEQLSIQDVDASNVDDLAVRLESSSLVLLHQRRVHRVLGRGQPLLQHLDVTLYVSVQNFWEDVFAHLGEERLHLEVGVHLAEPLDDHGGLILGKETCDAVGNTTSSLDNCVVGLVVDALHAEETLGELGVVLPLAPNLLVLGVLVERDVCARAAGC